MVEFRELKTAMKMKIDIITAVFLLHKVTETAEAILITLEIAVIGSDIK